jgi:hypothetical protein
MGARSKQSAVGSGRQWQIVSPYRVLLRRQVAKVMAKGKLFLDHFKFAICYLQFSLPLYSLLPTALSGLAERAGRR